MAELLMGAYALTGKLLSLLPIPINLPSLEETGGLRGRKPWSRHGPPCMIYPWIRSSSLCSTT
ncbi:hypothetical protein ACFQ0B_80440 [Nonomuraea thailandensis]